MKAGRFVVDCHVHAQRFADAVEPRRAPALAEEDRPVADAQGGFFAFDNTRRLQYDMDAYRVDMCVLLPALGMSDALNLEIVARAPSRYVAACGITDYVERCRIGVETWSVEGASATLDRMLATGRFVAADVPPIFTSAPGNEAPVARRAAAADALFAIAEVCSRRHVALRYHTVPPAGWSVAGESAASVHFGPAFAGDLAASFPDLTIVLDNGGVEAAWRARDFDDCLDVARAHDNVYIETGLWWRERYERPLADPGIGPEKLLWATDWGATAPGGSYGGEPAPRSYPVTLDGRRAGHHQVDYWGWSLRELTSLRLSQDDLNLILGGNAARVFKLDVACTCLFRPPAQVAPLASA